MASVANHRLLAYYGTGEWGRALTMAYEMGPLWKGELSGYYDAMIERMNEQKTAPKNWDGVFRATSK